MENETEIETGNIEVVDEEKLKLGGDSQDFFQKKEKKKFSKMVAFVMKVSCGHVENELQANIVFVVAAIIFFIISLFFFF